MHLRSSIPNVRAASRKGFFFKAEWLSILALFLLMRLLISGTAAAVLWKDTPAPPSWIQANHPSMQVFEQTATGTSTAARLLLNGWYRWDTGYFVKIGLYGYDAGDGSLSFMPLYPLAIRLMYMLTHANGLLLALVASNLLSIAAMILLFQVARLELGTHEAAWDALLYFITFPAAFFLFAGYSESINLVLVLSTWLLARSGRLNWAAFAASLAVLTRLQGAAVILPLAWQALVNYAGVNGLPPLREVTAVARALLQHSFNLSRFAAVLGSVLLPLGTLLLYNFGLQWSGLPTIFGTYADRNSSLAWPWIGLAEFIDRIFTIRFLPSDVVDLALLILFVGLTVIGAPKIRPALTLYSLGVLGMVFSRSYAPNLLSGFMRFALTTFPLFLLLAGLGLKPALKNLILLLFLITQLFMTWLFIRWIWVA